MFEYESKEFITRKDMEIEKKKLVDAIGKHFGLERNQFRLQQGMINLSGMYQGEVWMNVTSTIGLFPEKLKNKSYTSFKLTTKLVTK